MMPVGGPFILTINGGSSSIKFAVFDSADPPKRHLSGQVERIGLPGTQLISKHDGDSSPTVRQVNAPDHQQAAAIVIQHLQECLGNSSIAAIGHRVVHGGLHLLEHQLITPEVIAQLRKAEPLDLAHLPLEIALIEAFQKAFPKLPQVACFDTAFHRNMPRVAAMLPIPRHYFDSGVRRFGFHGLSYQYLMQRLAKIAGPDTAQGRVILAHLGSGASMAAVNGGKPIDTTMAFTPNAGLVMGTRPGDIDPGLLIYLMRTEKMTPEQMDTFISSRCGLIGISETTSDMRDLLKRRATDPRAAEAVDIFCYQARKFVGAFAAALGGLDTLVFSGGIGEHAPEVRAGICKGLEYLGLSLDPDQNSAAADVISHPTSRVTVRVIATDEEFIIAQTVRSFLPANALT